MRVRIRLALIAALTAAGFVALLGMTTLERGPNTVALELPGMTAVAPGGSELLVESEVVGTPFTMAGLAWEGEASAAVWYRVGTGQEGWSELSQLHFDVGHSPDLGTSECEAQRSGTDLR